MKNLLLVAVLMVLVTPISSAEVRALDIKFSINTDGSVSQWNRYIFDNPINSTINYTINGQAHNTVVSNGQKLVDFTQVKNNNGYILNIFITEPTNQLITEYTTDNVIFRLDSVEHFFTEFYFDNSIKNLTASLKLPVGYTLYDNSYKPGNAEIVSDGKSIVLLWKESNIGSILFSVKFIKPEQNASLWIAAIAVLAGSLLFVYFYFNQRKKEDILFGFRHDEKIAINYIQEKKIILQRDLEEEFKFSRAKVTRIVSKLVEKGLIKKQKYGRTNKLTWLK